MYFRERAAAAVAAAPLPNSKNSRIITDLISINLHSCARAWFIEDTADILAFHEIGQRLGGKSRGISGNFFGLHVRWLFFLQYCFRVAPFGFIVLYRARI